MMTRERALRYAREVAARLHRINGIVCTPNCGDEAVVVRRVWVFGSTAKGSRAPNDLDLLIDSRRAGRRWLWLRGRKLDKRYLRSYGIATMPEAERDFRLWLTRGMRKVSRHKFGIVDVPVDVKYLIYPRWDLPD